MRFTTLALFLCAGTTVFCQSNAPVPAIPDPGNPGNLWQLPPAFSQPQMNFQFPQDWNSLKAMPRTRIVVPKPGMERLLGDATIDSKIIVHPPQSSIGVQPPGTLVAQNLYPNLRVLPIDWPLAKLEAIPTRWPNYKLNSVSTQFCDDGCDGRRVRNGQSASVQARRK